MSDEIVIAKKPGYRLVAFDSEGRDPETGEHGVAHLHKIVWSRRIDVQWAPTRH